MYDNKLLDDIGRQILRILQEEGRISFNELGRRVGLSSPAVAERVRRMEEAGIILGYKAEVNYARIGYPIMAFIKLVVPMAQISQADELAISIPEVLECHHITGRDVIILKVAVTSVGHLEEVINQMGSFGMTTTAVVLSSPIVSRPLNAAKQSGV